MRPAPDGLLTSVRGALGGALSQAVESQVVPLNSHGSYNLGGVKCALALRLHRRWEGGLQGVSDTRCLGCCS